MAEVFLKFIINESKTLIEAIEQMTVIDTRLLIAVDAKQRFKSMLSMGDVQRGLMKGKSLNDSIQSILRNETIYARKGEEKSAYKAIAKEKGIVYIPVVDDTFRLDDIWFFSNILSKTHLSNCDLVIMAGGKGTRLQPLTNFIPKVLLPYKTHTILDEIIHKYESEGVSNVKIITNYMSDKVDQHVLSHEYNSEVTTFKEEEYLGTASSLTMIEEVVSDTIILSNCDVLLKSDLSEAIKNHRESNAVLTVVAFILSNKLSYGTLTVDSSGNVNGIHEKPTQVNFINSGIYLINKSCLKKIPSGTFYHMTDLISDLYKSGESVKIHAIGKDDWMDFGTWNNYLKNLPIND